ncbi:MAG: nucleotidyltransferase family protein [Flavonifractor plautii]
MATAGIVAEYNPFHWGHAWHIARTRRTLGADTAVVCVMSGHWVQRGSAPSRTNGAGRPWPSPAGRIWSLEPPHPWAMASAEAFARGAVGLLAATGVVDVLSFGSETGELAPLRAAAAALDGPDYPERLRAGLTRGLSFPAARQAAVGADCLASPNDNLGVEYLRALPPGMEALTIPRRGRPTTARRPGLRLRLGAAGPPLRAGRAAEADSLSPPPPGAGRRASMAHIDRAVLARLRTMDEADWAALPDGGAAEGLLRPGWRVPPGRRTARRTFMPGPRPESATLSRLGCGGWPWPPSWGCGRRGAAPGGALCTGAGPQRPGAGATAPHERDLCPSGGGQARPGQGSGWGRPRPL